MYIYIYYRLKNNWVDSNRLNDILNPGLAPYLIPSLTNANTKLFFGNMLSKGHERPNRSMSNCKFLMTDVAEKTHEIFIQKKILHSIYNPKNSDLNNKTF